MKLNHKQLFADLGLPLSPTQNRSQETSELKENSSQNILNEKEMLFHNKSIDQEICSNAQVDKYDYDDENDEGSIQNKNDNSYLVMNIDVGMSTHQQLIINKSDDPYYLAQKFCQDNCLHQDAVQVLAINIKNIQSSKGMCQNDEILQNNEQQYYFENKKIKDDCYQDKTQNISQNSIGIDGKSVSNELYRKGIEQIRLKQQKIIEHQREVFEKELRESTFTPNINLNSKNLIKRNLKYKIEDQLIQFGQIQKQKQNKLLQQKLDQEIKEFTFKPKINEISKRIASILNKENRKPDQQQKQLDIQENKKKRYSSKERFEFNQRMQSSISRWHEQKHHQQVEAPQQVPKICRAPKIQRNIENLPIGHYLHQIKKIGNENNQIYMSLNLQASLKSSQIYELTKKKKLQEIFQELDSDGDGMLSASNIDITTINIDILEVIAPILKEMEKFDLEINLEMFEEAGHKLLKNLNLLDRNKIMTSQINQQNLKEEDIYFQPQINKKSQQFVKQKLNCK